MGSLGIFLQVFRDFPFVILCFVRNFASVKKETISETFKTEYYETVYINNGFAVHAYVHGKRNELRASSRASFVPHRQDGL